MPPDPSDPPIPSHPLAAEEEDENEQEDDAPAADRLRRSILDHASTAIFLLDAEGRTTFMNPAAEALTGYAFAEARGRVLHDLVHRHRADGTPLSNGECPIGRNVLARGPLRDHEDVFARRDGTGIGHAGINLADSLEQGRGLNAEVLTLQF